MKKAFFILSFLTLISFLQGQNVDSLKDISFKSRGYEKGMSLYRIGKSYQKNNILDSAMLYFQKSLKYISSKKEQSEVYEDIGMVFFYKNDFSQTLENFNISLSFAKEINNDSIIARRYSDIGVAYDYLGAYDKATENYYKALLIFEKRNDLLAVGRIYNNLGIINQNRGETKSALEFYKKALKIKIETNSDSVLIAVSWVNIGSLYEELKEYKKALNLYYKSIDVFQKKSIKKNIALVYGNIASVKFSLGELDSTSFYLDKAIELNKEIGDDLGLSSNYLLKGKILLNKKNVNAAILLYHKALDLSNSLNVQSQKMMILGEMLQAYKDKHDYKSAFLFQEKLMRVNDTLSSEKANNKIETLKIVYQTEKKEKEILSLQKDVNKNRVLFIIISVIFTLLSLVVFLFLRNKLAKSKYEADLFNQRLLRLQMNPHFIFNTLASIQSYMFEKDTKQAALYLSSFSKLTRSILNNSREELITLKEDVETTENYLKIQKMRFENKFDYDVIIDDNIDAEIVQVPPMLIQPFVENAVIHGFKDITYKGEIKVIYKKEKGFLEIIIKDNGTGMHEKNGVGKHKSHALNITKERLKIINKNKKRLVAFKLLNNTEKGVKIFFSVPYITKL